MVRLFKIDRLKRQIDQHRPFSAQTRQMIQDQELLHCVHRSNALDGSTLSESETNLYLFSKITNLAHATKDHIAIENQKNAFNYIRQRATSGVLKISLEMIEELSEILTRNQPHLQSGLNKKDNLEQRIAFFESWLVDKRSQLHPVDLAMRVHTEIFRLNPCFAANGSIARLCQNYVLMINGLPAIIFDPEHVEVYRKAIQEACYGSIDSMLLLAKKELVQVMSKIKIILAKWPRNAQLSVKTAYKSENRKHLIYQIRKERLLTLDHLSGLTGISASKISRIENRQGDLSEEMLTKFAEALNVEVETLKEVS